MSHQNPKVMGNPPVPSHKLSPIVIAKGVQGIKWAMGISHLMPELRLSYFVMHGSIDVVLIRYMVGQFCHMLHGQRYVLTMSSKGIGLYCQNNVSELCR